MKICQIVPWFPSLNANTVESQQGIFEYRQLVKLAKRGHQFKVITVKWRGQSHHEVMDDNIEVYRIPPIFIFPKIRYPIPNLIALSGKIKEIHKEWRPDLLIYGHLIYLTALPIFWLKNKLPTPTIVTTPAFPGISWFYGNKVVDTVGYLYSKLVVRRILQLADGIQLMGAWLLADKERMNIDADKVFVCFRGVDTELFKPENDQGEFRKALGVSEGETLILYVGRLDLVKGVNYLLQAAKEILATYNNIKFLIVGDGSLRPEYERLAQPLSSNIIFTGWRKDIPQLMKMANIFVLPSLSEGAPNVIMEASASGLPVIATNVGEISQLVADGETGILVKPKDANALVKVIERLIDNPLLAKKMGEAGRRRMEQNYSWEIICGKLEKAYQAVIDRRNRQSHSF